MMTSDPTGACATLLTLRAMPRFSRPSSPVANFATSRPRAGSVREPWRKYSVPRANDTRCRPWSSTNWPAFSNTSGDPLRAPIEIAVTGRAPFVAASTAMSVK